LASISWLERGETKVEKAAMMPPLSKPLGRFAGWHLP
jgi:hypothetical protein